MNDKIEELTLLLLYLTGWDEEQLVYDENGNLLPSGLYEKVIYIGKNINGNLNISFD